MSKMSAEEGAARSRRADAVRSRHAILDAAARVLNERPEAGVGDIARAAGLTRQTVYAHYPTRQALLGAVVDRLTGEALAALDAARPDEGSPVDALVRLLEAAWDVLERHPLLLRAADQPVTAEQTREQHEPVLAPFERVVRRGQRSGDFDPDVPAGWLATVVVALGHAAGAEVAAGRLTHQQAGWLLRSGVLRILSAPAS